MNKSLLINIKQGLTPGKIIHRCSILCRNGKIAAIGGHSAFNDVQADLKVDLPEAYAMPGMIDPHLYGYMGYSFKDTQIVNNLDKISEYLVKHGVTTFVPTLPAMPKEEQFEVIKSLVAAIEKGTSGARVHGFNMIGPFISKNKRGANPLDGVRQVDLAELDEIIKLSKGHLKIMTYAPELAQSGQLVQKLLENNILPSMGHSIANAEQVNQSIESGARRCTHLFNGMAPIHQRKTGLASTVLVDNRITTELIFDGFHIDPQMIDLACRAKGYKKIIAVSAATQGAGLPDGTYNFQGQEVEIKDQRCHLDEETIAGSMLTQEQSWKNILQYTNLKDTEAIRCFTSNPAKNLQIKDRGYLHPGQNADLVVMSPEHEVLLTVRQGEIVFAKKQDYITQND